MSNFPVFAVRDGNILWHVQSDPEAAALLSGAWEAEGEKMESLLRGTVLVEADGNAIDEIYAAIVKELKALRAAAKAAKESKPSLTLPRFSMPDKPDVALLAEGFSGDEKARTAWACAMAVAELVQQWHGIEAQRRSRSYLAEEFGSQVRPLPWGA